MAPDLLLGLDEARKKELNEEAKCAIIDADVGRGKSKTIFCGWGKEAIIKPIAIADDSISLSESLNLARDKACDFGVHGFCAEWSCFCGTHKQARQINKFRREMALKKPRLPRKLKKRLRTDWKLYCIILKEYHSSVWPNAEPIIDFVEAKLAAIGLNYDIPDLNASMNIIQRAFDPEHNHYLD